MNQFDALNKHVIHFDTLTIRRIMGTKRKGI
jgi:hypothetical protein